MTPEQKADVEAMLVLLHETYSTISAAIRAGHSMGDDWPVEFDALFEKVGDFLYCFPDPLPAQRLGLMPLDGDAQDLGLLQAKVNRALLSRMGEHTGTDPCEKCGGGMCGLHPAGCVYGGVKGYWLVAEVCELEHDG